MAVGGGVPDADGLPPLPTAGSDVAGDTGAHADVTLAGDARPDGNDAGGAAARPGTKQRHARDRRAGAALARGDVIDRYVVLACLGAGGMGIVYLAYDPELNRKVALKLLGSGLALGSASTTTLDARARLAREAQALAKVAHPNVVAVHDVGEHEGAVWLAMEYIAGQTLADWLGGASRPWREVLSILVSAARGLDAIHRAGLVHRDFRPDNVMVSDDGRVRVMDLGIARVGDQPVERPSHRDAQASAVRAAASMSRGTHAGALLGTPAYMAPEQFEGADVDARTDVFSFCATLWEALYGQRPFAGASLPELATNVLEGRLASPIEGRRVPRWLRSVCTRGLAVAPRDRFASMQALLDALASGERQSQVRRALAAVGVMALATLAVWAGQRFDNARRVAECRQDGAAIAGTWNDARREQVRRGLLASGNPSAAFTAERVVEAFDAQARAWSQARTEACLDARVRGVWTRDLLDRATWCLDERRIELDALAEELAHADLPATYRAIPATAAMESVGSCRDRVDLERLTEPPSDRAAVNAVREMLGRAGALDAAGHYERALVATREAAVAANALGWTPLILRAQADEGALLGKTGAYADAERVLERAYFHAARLGDWAIASDAATTLLGLVGGRLARHKDGVRWFRIADLALARLGEGSGSLRRAGALNNLANAHDAGGECAQAEDLYRRTLAERERVLGAEHPDVAASRHNLATFLAGVGRLDEAFALSERAMASWERSLGPKHPDVAMACNNLASIHVALGAYDKARPLYARAVEIRIEALGAGHPDVAGTLSNLALTHSAAGDYQTATELHLRALEILEASLGQDHVALAATLNSLGNIAYHTGDYAQALRHHERALAIRTQAHGPRHRNVAMSLENLASVHEATGANDEAIALYRSALEIYKEAIGTESSDVARTRYNLALVYAGRDDHAQARELHTQALAAYEAALGPNHPDVAAPLIGLAQAAMALHQPVVALPLAQRAVRVLVDHDGAADEQGAASFVLARALWDAPVDAGRDRPRAMREAAAARERFTEIEGQDDALEEVTRWLVDRGGQGP